MEKGSENGIYRIRPRHGPWRPYTRVINVLNTIKNKKKKFYTKVYLCISKMPKTFNVISIILYRDRV